MPLAAVTVGQWIAIAITAGTAVDQADRARRTEHKQEDLQKVQQAQSADQASRERRKQIRQQMTAQAQIDNAAATQGQQASSSPIAASANVQSQVNENIGNINTAQAFGAAKGAIQQDIFNLQQPSTLQTAAGIYNNIFETPKITSG